MRPARRTDRGTVSSGLPITTRTVSCLSGLRNPGVFIAGATQPAFMQKPLPISATTVFRPWNPLTPSWCPAHITSHAAGVLICHPHVILPYTATHLNHHYTFPPFKTVHMDSHTLPANCRRPSPAPCGAPFSIAALNAIPLICRQQTSLPLTAPVISCLSIIWL